MLLINDLQPREELSSDTNITKHEHKKGKKKKAVDLDIDKKQTTHMHEPSCYHEEFYSHIDINMTEID